MLPHYSSNIVNDYGAKVVSVNKLILHLVNKSKHVLHHKSLPLYLSLGEKLKYEFWKQNFKI